MPEAGTDMRDLTGWVKISCDDSEQIRDQHRTSGLRPVSSLTDLAGEFGRRVIYTEWAPKDDEESPVLRDYLWNPRRYDTLSGAFSIVPAEDVERCEHYRPEEASS